VSPPAAPDGGRAGGDEVFFKLFWKNTHFFKIIGKMPRYFQTILKNTTCYVEIVGIWTRCVSEYVGIQTIFVQNEWKHAQVFFKYFDKTLTIFQNNRKYAKVIFQKCTQSVFSKFRDSLRDAECQGTTDICTPAKPCRGQAQIEA
jgi:hypothetical protein